VTLSCVSATISQSWTARSLFGLHRDYPSNVYIYIYIYIYIYRRHTYVLSNHSCSCPACWSITIRLSSRVFIDFHVKEEALVGPPCVHVRTRGSNGISPDESDLPCDTFPLWRLNDSRAREAADLL